MDAAKSLSAWTTIALAALAVTVVSSFVAAFYARRLKLESETKVAQLEERLSDADTRIANADHVRQNAESALAEEQLRRTELEQQNARLQVQLAKGRPTPAPQPTIVPRHLSNEQAVIIISAIRSFAGAEVTVSRVLGDAEAGQYATQLIAVLRSAGWKAQSNLAPLTSPPLFGLTYQAIDPDNVPAPIAALLEGFRASDIPFTVTVGRGVLLVAGQPPPL